MLAERQRDRFWKLTATAASLLVIVLIAAQFIYSRTAQAMSPPERIAVVNGEAAIPVLLLSDHKLHRYSIEIGGTEVRVITILDPTDTVRTALDACTICGSQGYYQDGKNVICRNCAAAINIPTIGVAGGCNPIHIDYRIEGETLRIGAVALTDARKFFQ